MKNFRSDHMQNATVLSLASSSTSAELPLLARYNSYFRTQAADTQELIETAQAIRYQVYCLERQFENADEHHTGLESDAFDAAAVHSLVIHRPSGDAMGTARLILPQRAPEGLPIEQLLAENGFRAGNYFPVATAAEVSRFAISNTFRRRPGDNGVTPDSRTRDRECRSALPCLGLIQEVLRQSNALGLTHWAAVMEPKLLRMLALMGIHFTPVGPLVSHHGLRQPSYACIAQVLERLKRERPDHWMVVTDAGRLVPAEQPVVQRRAA
jgi:N-acyl amino acid synthase of PEP-CTERM/exosortase system